MPKYTIENLKVKQLISTTFQINVKCIKSNFCILKKQIGRCRYNHSILNMFNKTIIIYFSGFLLSLQKFHFNLCNVQEKLFSKPSEFDCRFLVALI